MSACIDCPVIQNEFDNRLIVYGYEMITKYPQDKEWIMENDIIAHCWCDKTGGEICHTGRCYNSSIYCVKKNARKKRKRTRRERDCAYKRKLETLFMAYPADKNGRYVEQNEQERFAYYKRVYRGNRKGLSTTYWKKISNRKIRRYKGDISNGFMCHKIFEYRWHIN